MASSMIVYAYGALAPRTQLARVREQMFLAHRYRNDLIRVELDRRAARDAELRRLRPDLAALDAALAEADRVARELAASLKAANAEARKRTTTPEQRKTLASAREAAREARRRCREAAREARQATDVQEALSAVNAAAVARGKQLRAACGCYWATYLQAEEAAQAAAGEVNPRFRRWDGRGKVAVQLQGGLSVGDRLVAVGGDTRLQLHVPAAQATREPRADLWMRVGSEGRAPVWAVIPIVYDRPLPPGAVIKWVFLMRRTYGTREVWGVRLVLDTSCCDPLVPADRAALKPAADCASEGRVGMDVGWRLVAGGLRVACWIGDDGGEGTLVLPQEWLSRWPRIEQLQSTRDQLFDGIRSVLRAWGRGEAPPDWLAERVEWLRNEAADDRRRHVINPRWQKLRYRDRRRDPSVTRIIEAERDAYAALLAGWMPPPDGASPWLRNELAHLHSWRSPGRLVRLVREWQDAEHPERRTPGDGPLLAVLAAWQIRDRHLWDWTEGLRRKLIAQRDAIFHEFAATLRRRYHTIVVEDADWRPLLRRPDSLESPPDEGARVNARLASVGRLRQTMKAAVAELIEAPSEWTTVRCAQCGRLDAFDARRELVRKCCHCGHEEDQDRRAARNLLAWTPPPASDEEVDENPGPARNTEEIATQ